MFITDLFEATDPSNTIVIYPGRFQPWHKGHRAVYDYLVRLYGRDSVFIATSNKVDPPRSPFSFGEKVQFMNLTGVSSDRIVETRDPYKAIEIVQNYNPQTTRLIFAVSEKDMAEDPRFRFGYKKDGSPTYLQAMPKNPAEMQPFETHGYVMTVPTFNFTVLGEPMRSATEVRAQFAQADSETQQAIIKDLFGRYSPEIHSLMKQKIVLSESVRPLQDTNNVTNEGDVVYANFGSGKYYKNPDIKIPKYDPVRRASVIPSLQTGREVPFSQFETIPASTRSDAHHIIGITNDGKRIRVSTTSNKELADALADAYNRGGFTDKSIQKVPLKPDDVTEESSDEYRRPGASYSQTARVINKLHPTDNKFIWKKPNQIGGSYTDQQLTSMGFKKSKFNSWGGTQSMWNRLSGIKEQLNQSTPSAQEVLKKHNMTPEELVKQLKLGVKVELEHTKDAKVAYEIALDHLNERPDYYTVLTKSGIEEGSGQEPGWFEIYNTRTLERVYHPFEAENIMDAFVKADDWLEAIGKPGRGLSVRPVKETDVAEDPLNELAPGGGGEGNGPFDYGSAIVTIGEDFIDHFNDEGAGADAAAIIKVGQTFMASGMTAGINAFYMMDTQLRDHVAAQLEYQGFNVRQDLYKPFADIQKLNRAELIRKHNEYINSQEYKDRRADDLKISAIPIKPINAGDKPGQPVASVTMDNASKRNIKAEFEKFKQDLAWRDSLKGVPLKFEITIGGKPIDINKLGEQGVAEDAAGVGVVAQNKKMAKDPRYSMSISKDVKPGQDKKNMRALRLIK